MWAKTALAALVLALSVGIALVTSPDRNARSVEAISLDDDVIRRDDEMPREDDGDEGDDREPKDKKGKRDEGTDDGRGQPRDRHPS